MKKVSVFSWLILLLVVSSLSGCFYPYGYEDDGYYNHRGHDRYRDGGYRDDRDRDGRYRDGYRDRR